MLDWLIIGGGIHGTHLSLVLTACAGVERDRVRVLDPHPEPMAVWNRRTASVGMKHLRSSLVHHVGVEPMALARFGGLSRRRGSTNRFRGRYRRPGYEIFQSHCASVVRQHRLEELRIAGGASGMRRVRDGWAVETGDGVLCARRVVLALGQRHRAPDPARPYPPGVRDLLDPGVDTRSLSPGTRVAVIGRGMSAVQAALSLARSGHCHVTWIARGETRKAEFDSDPCYMGDKCLQPFWATASWETRRALVREARQPGTVTPSVALHLGQALARGDLEAARGEATGFDAHPGGGWRVILDQGRAAGPFDRVLLGSGLDDGRPDGWIRRDLVEGAGLSVAPCGFPTPSPSLEWGDGVHVSGPLAELELGPVSRNIIGARHSAERLKHVAAAERRTAFAAVA